MSFESAQACDLFLALVFPTTVRRGARVKHFVSGRKLPLEPVFPKLLRCCSVVETLTSQFRKTSSAKETIVPLPLCEMSSTLFTEITRASGAETRRVDPPELTLSVRRQTEEGCFPGLQLCPYIRESYKYVYKCLIPGTNMYLYYI